MSELLVKANETGAFNKLVDFFQSIQTISGTAIGTRIVSGLLTALLIYAVVKVGSQALKIVLSILVPLFFIYAAFPGVYEALFTLIASIG